MMGVGVAKKITIIFVVLAPLIGMFAACDAFTAGPANPNDDAATASDAADGSKSSGDDGGVGDAIVFNEAAAVSIPCEAGLGALLCDDFDNTKYDAGWSQTDIDPPGAVVVLPFADSPTQPNVLSAALPTAAADVGFARLVYTIPGEWSALRIGFDLYVADTQWSTPSGAMSVAGVAYDGANGFVATGIDVLYEQDQLHMNISEPFWGGQSILPIYNRWNHIEMDLRPNDAGGVGAAMFYVNGALVSHTETAIWKVEQRTKTRVYFGLDRYNDSTPSFTVQYDNIRIERWVP